jgi:hypothetical protein
MVTPPFFGAEAHAWGGGSSRPGLFRSVRGEVRASHWGRSSCGPVWGAAPLDARCQCSASLQGVPYRRAAGRTPLPVCMRPASRLTLASPASTPHRPASPPAEGPQLQQERVSGPNHARQRPRAGNRRSWPARRGPRRPAPARAAADRARPRLRRGTLVRSFGLVHALSLCHRWLAGLLGRRRRAAPTHCCGPRLLRSAGGPPAAALGPGPISHSEGRQSPK